MRIEPVHATDMTRCGSIITSAFASIPIAPSIFSNPNPASENAAVVGARQYLSQVEHNAVFPSVPVGIKCVYTDPVTGEESIAGYAEWYFYDRERTPQEACVDTYAFRYEWVQPLVERERCLAFFRPMKKQRERITGMKRFGYLVYMCVDERFRRMGAATRCVTWGMERARELGVPTYLEATEEGMAAYKKLGWEVVQGDGMYPPMMWWPEGVERWA
jgi:GNAT superfamily N-acetyltransferase